MRQSRQHDRLAFGCFAHLVKGASKSYEADEEDADSCPSCSRALSFAILTCGPLGCVARGDEFALCSRGPLRVTFCPCPKFFPLGTGREVLGGARPDRIPSMGFVHQPIK